MGAQEGHKAGVQDEEVSPQALARQKMGHKPGRNFPPGISTSSHEGQQELGHRMGWQCWQLGRVLHGMEDGGSRQGLRAGRAAHRGMGSGTSL